VFLLSSAGALFVATSIVFIKFNIGFFTTETARTALTVQVALRDSYAYNSSGQAS
jgi:hypothetical protein